MQFAWGIPLAVNVAAPCQCCAYNVGRWLGVPNSDNCRSWRRILEPLHFQLGSRRSLFMYSYCRKYYLTITTIMFGYNQNSSMIGSDGDIPLVNVPWGPVSPKNGQLDWFESWFCGSASDDQDTHEPALVGLVRMILLVAGLGISTSWLLNCRRKSCQPKLNIRFAGLHFLGHLNGNRLICAHRSISFAHTGN